MNNNAEYKFIVRDIINMPKIGEYNFEVTDKDMIAKFFSINDVRSLYGKVKATDGDVGMTFDNNVINIDRGRVVVIDEECNRVNEHIAEIKEAIINAGLTYVEGKDFFGFYLDGVYDLIHSITIDGRYTKLGNEIIDNSTLDQIHNANIGEYVNSMYIDNIIFDESFRELNKAILTHQLPSSYDIDTIML